MHSLKLFSFFLALLLKPVAADDNQCGKCDASKIWLDVVFVVESTEGVGKQNLEQIESFLLSTLMQTTISPEHLRIGVVAYANDPVIVTQLSAFNSTDELMNKFELPLVGGGQNDPESALRKATELFEMDHRPNVRKVAVLIASSLNTISSMPIEIGNDFREDGGVLIVIEFVSKHGAHVPAIHELASSGYVLSTADETLHADDLLNALCDANCYCAPGHTPLSTNERQTPDGGCYLASDATASHDKASQSCSSIHAGAHLSIVNNEKMNKAIFESAKWQDSPFWIGAKLRNGKLFWEGSTSAAPPNSYSAPLHLSSAIESCVYAKQTAPQQVEWFAAPCSTPQNFVCQSSPLSSFNRELPKAHSRYRKFDSAFIQH